MKSLVGAAGGIIFHGPNVQAKCANPRGVAAIEDSTMRITSQHLLLAYSTILSTVFAVTALGSQRQSQIQSFDEIQVHRINVVEPDGTLRMVISNKARLPGVIVKGKEQPPSDRPQAGMIFYNDEGSENGGLIFSGRNEHGDVLDSGGSLSFDKYGANQVVQLIGVDDKSDRFAGLSVSDDNQRIWVGRNEDGAAKVSLMDKRGKPRIVMQVAGDGTPSLTFYDAQGNAQKFVSAPH
jgi:hypothetical protein